MDSPSQLWLQPWNYGISTGCSLESYILARRAVSACHTSGSHAWAKFSRARLVPFSRQCPVGWMMLLLLACRQAAPIPRRILLTQTTSSLSGGRLFRTSRGPPAQGPRPCATKAKHLPAPSQPMPRYVWISDSMQTGSRVRPCKDSSAAAHGMQKAGQDSNNALDLSIACLLELWQTQAGIPDCI